MIYDIANLKVEIKNENGRTEKQAIPYLAQNQDEKNIDINDNIDCFPFLFEQYSEGKIFNAVT